MSAVNPYIEKILLGQNPSARDFIGGQSPFPPGINPAGSNPQQAPGLGKKPGPFNKLDQFIGTPGGSFLMNLLAQSGYSKTPQSPFGAIGRAALLSQNQQQQRQQLEMRKKLIESQIGLNEAKSVQEELNPSAQNVQSQFITSDGKLGYLQRNGEVVVTDTDVKDSYAIQTLADGSQIGVNRSNPSDTVPVVSAREAKDAATRKSQTQAGFTLPTDLAGLDASIAKADATIDKIKEVQPLIVDENVGIESTLRGDLPGFLGGDARTLKKQVKSLQANFGFDTLQRMRAASKTGGALGQVSERELDLLINALRSIDLEGKLEPLQSNVQAVITHYENYKREIEKMKVAMMEQAGQTPDASRPMSEMTDAELEAIASGGNP